MGLSIRIFGKMCRIGLLMAGVAAAACSPNSERIYAATLTGGDYAVLTCKDLETAILSIEQRLAGGGAAELSGPLSVQRDQLATARQTRDCPGDKAVNPSVVLATPTSEPAPDGRRLQVATFRDPKNRDETEAALAAAGFTVDVVPITLAGQPHYRLVIGPLADRDAVRRADALLEEIGLNDAFFVN